MWGKKFDRYVWAILGSAALILVWNTISHPSAYVYDGEAHNAGIRWNMMLRHWDPVLLPGNLLDHTPVLYYYLLGKVFRPLEIIYSLFAGHNLPEMATLYFARIMHIVSYLTIAWLYFKRLFPKISSDSFLQHLALLAFFSIPGVYLSQVMVRSEQLLFLLFNLFLLIWFTTNLRKQLSTSNKALIVWALGIIALANTRNMGLAAILVFFPWGLYELLKAPQKNGKAWARIGITTLLVVALSSAFYVNRSLSRGKIFSLGDATSKPGFSYEPTLNDPFLDKKIRMFTNMDFHKVLIMPNRNTFAGDNAFFPRLWNDMWADHWLYYSGKKLEDDKITGKRILLALSIPFSLFFFFLPIFYAWKFFSSLRRRVEPTAVETAGLITCITLALLCFAAWTVPEIGKNSVAKFTYIFQITWFPILCMMDWFNARRKWIKPAGIYLAVLATASVYVSVYVSVY